MSRLPLIGVTACSRQVGLQAYPISGDNDVRAVAVAAKGLPLILHSLGEWLEPSDILDGLEGPPFTGSCANVNAHLHGGPASAPGTAHDSARERTTLPLIRTAVAARIPVLGVCQGFEEMNMVFGNIGRKRIFQRDADTPRNA
ncbi:gamma-glutamyl-gamma-aminobutyrate hydrolase family protein [Pseudomonas gingeri]|nr:gamma-glutamyl-gamma-aminobutyrate hydrolase family protein [Pseudomonas gingeri]